MKIEDYQAIAREMVAEKDEVNRFFRKLDDIYHVRWEKPVEWQDIKWIRVFKTPEAANALDTGVRTLSTNLPTFSITPLASNPETRESFNRLEQALQWTYSQGHRRPEASPTRNIVESAIKYDEVAAQVVYLPYQQRALKAINSKNAARAAKYGPFSFTVHNPQTVFTSYSDYGLERVLLVKTLPAYKVVSFWGDLAKSLERDLTGKGKSKESLISESVTIFDMTDLENRVVWVSMNGADDKGKVYPIIAPNSEQSKNDMGFISWAHGIGGSSIDPLSDHTRKPLLANVAHADAWENQMLFASLMFSLTMARAAEPVTVSETLTGEGADIDATEPLAQIKTKPGEKVDRLPPSEVGQSTKEMFDRLTNYINTMGGVEVLRALNVPQGTAYATLNQVLGAALAALDPYKQLAEDRIADIGRLMAQWHRFTTDPMLYYQQDSKDLTNFGNEVMVRSEEIPEPQDLYLKVVLKPWIPSDEMQKVNTVIMKSKSLQYPVVRALEELNVADAERAVSEWRQEQKDNAALQQQIVDIQFEADMLRQDTLRKKQQENTAPPPPEGGVAGAPFAQTQGQGFNPAMGGASPTMAAPDMTREMITGMAKQPSGGNGSEPPMDERGLANFPGVQ